MIALKSFFWKILFSFLTFTGAMSLFFAIYVFFAADHLAHYLLAQQVQPVMIALIEAEKREATSPHTRSQGWNPDLLARAINGTFLVGRQIPSKWAEKEDGLYIDRRRFIYLMRDHGVLYSLSGSASPLRRFLQSIGKGLIAATLLGLMTAGIIAWYLSHNLSSPLAALTKVVKGSSRHQIVVPEKLASRQDETGILAKAIIDQQKEAKAYWDRETAFTGDISHELRTPLAIMRGTLELIQCKYATPGMASHLLCMEKTLDGMAGTLHALLALARKSSPQLEAIPVAELLGEELGKIERGTLPEIQREISCLTTPLGQRELAATALRNILINAILYCPEDGKILIRVDKNQCFVQNTVFSGCQSSSGAGLGLSITSRCCEKMGWKFNFQISHTTAVATIIWPDYAEGLS